MDIQIEAKDLLSEDWEELVIQQSQPQKVSRASDYFLSYSTEMERVRESCQRAKLSFSDCETEYDEQIFESFSFRVVEERNNFEMVVLQVKAGGFTICLKVLNRSVPSPLSKVKSSREGNFGKVHLVECDGQTRALKWIPFFSPGKLHQKKKILSKVIKEYSISKMAEGLRVGPALPRISGFDLIVYSNAIQFVMEKCQSLSSFSEGDELSLLENMGTLHRFKIMHMDINPDNMMFSQTFGKTVFIDFGLSEVIEENCGQQTYTSYRGTPQFVCKEMLALLLVETKGGFVDLYHNDLVSLQETVRRLEQKNASKNSVYAIDLQDTPHEKTKGSSQKPDKSELSYEHLSHFLLFKFVCFFEPSDIETVFRRHKQAFLTDYPKQTLQLFLNLLPSFIIERIFFSDFDELRHLDDYSEVIMGIKMVQEDSLGGRIRKDENISPQFKKLFTPEDFMGESLDDDEQNNRKLIFERLKDKNCFDNCQDKSQYFSRLLDCLRFDQKNFEVSEKFELAAAFLGFIGEKTVNEAKDPLPAFQEVFKHLLSYCLRESSPVWRKQNRFDLMFQAVLTDTNILEELTLLQKTIEKEQNLYELFDLFCELLRIDLFFDKKIFFEDHDLGLETIGRVKLVLDTLNSKILKTFSIQSPQQQKTVAVSMIQILNLRRKSKPFSKDLYCELHRITDNAVRYEITHFLLMLELEENYVNNLNFEFDEVQHRIKTELFHRIQFKRRNFVDRVSWDWIIGSKISWKSQIQIFIESVRKSINYDKLYANLTFTTFSDNAAILGEDKTELLNQVKKMTQALFQDKRFETLILMNYIDGQAIDILKSDREALKYFCHEYLRYSIEEGCFIVLNQTVNPPEYQIKKQSKLAWKVHGSILTIQGIYNMEEGLTFKVVSSIFCNQNWKFIQKMAKGQNMDLQDFNYFQNWYQITFTSIYIFSPQKQYINMKWHLQMLEKFDSPSHHEKFIYSLRFLGRQMKQLWSPQIRTISEERWGHLALWIFRYARVKGLVQQIYIHLSGFLRYVLGQLLQILHVKKLDEQMQFLLKKIIEIVSRDPKQNSVRVFNENFQYFFKIFTFSFSYLKRCFWPITWQNRYCLLIFTQTLFPHATDKEAIHALIVIANNIHTIHAQMKKAILHQYYSKICMCGKLNILNSERKRRFVIFRLAFRYHNQCQCQIPHNKKYMFVTRLKKSKNPLRTKLREKVDKKINLYSNSNGSI